MQDTTLKKCVVEWPFWATVGFGLSPNGQMPGSDVVIGWVDDDGNAHFHVGCSLYLSIILV